MSTNPAITTHFSEHNLFETWYAREPMLARFCLGVLAITPLLLLAVIIDERTQYGLNIWIKPIKFNIAIAVYLATLVWFSGWIDRALMLTFWYRLYTWILCGSMVVLFAWLYSAALIGEPAHYNRSHFILAPLYRLMGVVSVTFTAGTVVVAGLIAFSNQASLTTYFRYMVISSLLISFVATVVIAGELASMDSHWIGGIQSDKGGLPLFGWSRDGGDLRVAHFFALHAMQAIPMAATLVLPKRLERMPLRSTLLLSVTYCGIILFVYFQAKQGLPFIPWLG